MEIILIQRQGKGISPQKLPPMWLAWIGLEKLALISLWKLYLRRFALEHWNRFALAKVALDPSQIEQPGERTAME